MQGGNKNIFICRKIVLNIFYYINIKRNNIVFLRGNNLIFKVNVLDCIKQNMIINLICMQI